jgi:hypothetical protein
MLVAFQKFLRFDQLQKLLLTLIKGMEQHGKTWGDHHPDEAWLSVEHPADRAAANGGTLRAQCQNPERALVDAGTVSCCSRSGRSHSRIQFVVQPIPSFLLEDGVPKCFRELSEAEPSLRANDRHVVSPLFLPVCLLYFASLFSKCAHSSAGRAFD